MTRASDYQRVNFEVDRETFNLINEYLPWGLKARVYRKLSELIVEAVKEHGPIFLGALLAGKIVLAPLEDEDPDPDPADSSEIGIS